MADVAKPYFSQFHIVKTFDYVIYETSVGGI